jgi:HPt (histidine-containing phosphotransfer) domain-containing protein
MVRHLKKTLPGFSYHRVQNEKELRNILEGEKWDIVISDYALEAMDAFVALAIVRSKDTAVPFFLVSGSTNEAIAAQAAKMGAAGTYSKDALGPLVPAILKVLAKGPREAGIEAPKNTAPNPDLDALLDPGQIALIRELEVDGSAGLLTKLIGIFLNDTPARLEKIKAAAAAKEWNTVSREAHLLAGGAAGIGAIPIRELAAKIERAADSATKANFFPEDLGALEQECAKLCVRLASALGDTPKRG